MIDRDDPRRVVQAARRLRTHCPCDSPTDTAGPGGGAGASHSAGLTRSITPTTDSARQPVHRHQQLTTGSRRDRVLDHGDRRVRSRYW
jgi:hypothetical protein